jgi:hypothetical protein
MFNTIIAGKKPPRYLSSDHDPLFTFHRWQANLRILEVREIKSIPTVPLSHPFVERVIGTIRREFLDHLMFWNGRDLERKLEDFQNYYNYHRGHAALGGQTPAEVNGASRRQRAQRCVKEAASGTGYFQLADALSWARPASTRRIIRNSRPTSVEHGKDDSPRCVE